MTADVGGLAIATRNANDGMSSAQTEENAMSEVTNMLQRMTAVVGKTVVTGSTTIAAALTGTITINGFTTASVARTTNAASRRTLVKVAINLISGQTGVKAMDTGDDNAELRPEAADERNIILAPTTLTAAATELKVGAHSASIGLVSQNGNSIEIGSTAAGRVSRTGFSIGTFERGVSAVTSDVLVVATAFTTANMLNADDLKINGIVIPRATNSDDTATDASALSSKKAGSVIAAAINASSAKTGATAT